MTHDSMRRPRRQWTWTFVGLVQIGNAAAFGAVATTVDFSAGDEHVAAAATAENSAVQHGTSTETNGSPGVTAAPETAARETAALETAASTGATDDAAPAASDTPMPTFAVSPDSPMSESVAWRQQYASDKAPPDVAPLGDESGDEERADIAPGGAASSTGGESAFDPPPPPVPAVENAAENAMTVRFMVNGELVELRPGERRELAGGDSWVVRFHRGGQFGAATEILYGGEHRFVVDQRGWRLESVSGAAAQPLGDQ